MKFLTILFCLCLQYAFGQTVWTLQACIDSAQKYNNRIGAASIDQTISELSLNAENLNFLPTVNANMSHGYNWGQTIDQFTNQFATNRVQYNNFYLSSSVDLFTGLKNQNARKLAAIDHSIDYETLEILKRDLTLDIIAAYLQAKLNEEVVELSEKHAFYSTQNLERLLLLEQLNYETKRAVLEVKAQFSKDQYALILAQNEYRKSIFKLQELIGINQDSSLILSDSLALTSRFSANELSLNELYAERGLIAEKQSKSELYPQLTLNGSLGTGYSENNKFIDPNGMLIPKRFNTQLNENFYQSVSVNLFIPIFNGVKGYAQIKIKELEIERIKLENEQRFKERESRLLNYRLELVNQNAAFQAAYASFQSFQLLYSEAEIQLTEGTLDYYSFLKAKESFQKSEIELIQSKYRVKMSELILLSNFIQ